MILDILRNFLPFKDGGAIPPSNAFTRMKKPLERLAKPVPQFFGFPKHMLQDSVAKKRGGAVRKKGKKSKAKK